MIRTILSLIKPISLSSFLSQNHKHRQAILYNVEEIVDEFSVSRPCVYQFLALAWAIGQEYRKKNNLSNKRRCRKSTSQHHRLFLWSNCLWAKK